MVVLARYREKHPEKKGSWLYGARGGRWAVVGDDRGFDPPGTVTLTPFLGFNQPMLHIVSFFGMR